MEPDDSEEVETYDNNYIVIGKVTSKRNLI